MDTIIHIPQFIEHYQMLFSIQQSNIHIDLL